MASNLQVWWATLYPHRTLLLKEILLASMLMLTMIMRESSMPKPEYDLRGPLSILPMAHIDHGLIFSFRMRTEVTLYQSTIDGIGSACTLLLIWHRVGEIITRTQHKLLHPSCPFDTWRTHPGNFTQGLYFVLFWWGLVRVRFCLYLSRISHWNWGNHTMESCLKDMCKYITWVN